MHASSSSHLCCYLVITIERATIFTRKYEQITMQVYKPGDNEQALNLRSDIRTGRNGLDISEDAVMSCIPDRFIHLVLTFTIIRLV